MSSELDDQIPKPLRDLGVRHDNISREEFALFSAWNNGITDEQRRWLNMFSKLTEDERHLLTRTVNGLTERADVARFEGRREGKREGVITGIFVSVLSIVGLLFLLH